MSSIDLKIPAIIVAVILPLISARLLSTRGQEYVLRLGQVLVAYALMLVLISFGYRFQGFVTERRSPYEIFNLSVSARMSAEFQQMWDPPQMFLIITVSSIVCFALLAACDARKRTTNTLRVSFFCFTAFDIFVGVEAGYTVGDYLTSIAFNFIGALLLASIASLLLRWVPFRPTSISI